MFLGIGLKLDNAGVLSTSEPLDRESTAKIPFQLICTVNDPLSTSIFTLVQNGTLLVEDEDDNPPRLQSPDEQQVINVYLKGKGIVQVKRSFEFD